jgi:hypothetical protein
VAYDPELAARLWEVTEQFCRLEDEPGAQAARVPEGVCGKEERGGGLVGVWLKVYVCYVRGGTGGGGGGDVIWRCVSVILTDGSVILTDGGASRKLHWITRMWHVVSCHVTLRATGCSLLACMLASL